MHLYMCVYIIIIIIIIIIYFIDAKLKQTGVRM